MDIKVDGNGLEEEDNAEDEIGFLFRAELNGMANVFYRMQGYEQQKGFDFSSSPHPTEQLMFALAKASYTYWLTGPPKEEK